MFGIRHPVTADRKQCHRRVAFWLVAVASLVLATTRALAEEHALLSYDNPFPRADSMTLWDAPRTAPSAAVEIILDLNALSELWKGDFDLSSLFHHGTDGARHSSASKATLHAGLGQYFPDQPVVALATKGVGFEDLHWVYVKLCLSF